MSPTTLFRYTPSLTSVPRLVARDRPNHQLLLHQLPPARLLREPLRDRRAPNERQPVRSISTPSVQKVDSVVIVYAPSCPDIDEMMYSAIIIGTQAVPLILHCTFHCSSIAHIYGGPSTSHTTSQSQSQRQRRGMYGKGKTYCAGTHPASPPRRAAGPRRPARDAGPWARTPCTAPRGPLRGRSSRVCRASVGRARGLKPCEVRADVRGVCPVVFRGDAGDLGGALDAGLHDLMTRTRSSDWRLEGHVIREGLTSNLRKKVSHFEHQVSGGRNDARRVKGCARESSDGAGCQVVEQSRAICLGVRSGAATDDSDGMSYLGFGQHRSHLVDTPKVPAVPPEMSVIV